MALTASWAFVLVIAISAATRSAMSTFFTGWRSRIRDKGGNKRFKFWRGRRKLLAIIFCCWVQERAVCRHRGRLRKKVHLAKAVRFNLGSVPFSFRMRYESVFTLKPRFSRDLDRLQRSSLTGISTSEKFLISNGTHISQAPKADTRECQLTGGTAFPRASPRSDQARSGCKEEHCTHQQAHADNPSVEPSCCASPITLSGLPRIARAEKMTMAIPRRTHDEAPDRAAWPSGLLRLYFRVKTFGLHARVLCGELPVNADLLPIALLRPMPCPLGNSRFAP